MQSKEAPTLGELSPDEALRKQCLTWAFQTRDLMDVPHMQVVNVAEAYYRFIRPPAADDGAQAGDRPCGIADRVTWGVRAYTARMGTVTPSGTVQPGISREPATPACHATVQAPKPLPKD